MLYKVVLPFESVHEILKCDHSNKSYGAVVLWCLLFFVTSQNETRKKFEFLFWALLSLKKYHMLMMIVVTATINVI